MTPFLRTPLLFAVFAAIAASVVMIATILTQRAHIQNKIHAETLLLQQLISPNAYNNVLLEDSIQVTAENYLGNDLPHTIYRARLHDKPVALLINATASDGYAGDIHLLIGVRADNTLLGVRVLQHQETPGLGDQYQKNNNAWLKFFENKSLADSKPSDWTVKKQGGAFDQWTGATITPQAIVKSVARVLSFTKRYEHILFYTQEDIIIRE